MLSDQHVGLGVCLGFLGKQLVFEILKHLPYMYDIYLTKLAKISKAPCHFFLIEIMLVFQS